MAANIEDINNKDAQKVLGEFLAHYPDPAIRLILAENRKAPKKLLAILAEDEDADVAAAAQNTLE